MKDLFHSDLCTKIGLGSLVNNCQEKLNNMPRFGLHVIYSDYLTLLHNALEMFHESKGKRKEEKMDILSEELFNDLNLINYVFVVKIKFFFTIFAYLNRFVCRYVKYAFQIVSYIKC